MNIGSIFINIYDSLINDLADEKIKLSPSIRAMITPDIRSIKFVSSTPEEEEDR